MTSQLAVPGKAFVLSGGSVLRQPRWGYSARSTARRPTDRTRPVPVRVLAHDLPRWASAMPSALNGSLTPMPMRFSTAAAPTVH